MISGDFAFYATGRWVGSSQAAACRRSRSRYGCCTVTGCIRKRPHLSIPHVLGAALPIISLALVFRPQLAALAARASSRSAAARTASIGYRSTSTFQRWLSQSSRIVVGGAAYPYAASGCDPRVRDAKRIEHGHAELGVAPRLNTSCR